jgi:hypothetical protein
MPPRGIEPRWVRWPPAELTTEATLHSPTAIPIKTESETTTIPTLKLTELTAATTSSLPYLTRIHMHRD